MKKFSITLNQSQQLFLTNCLPKGYSFAKLKDNLIGNHSMHQIPKTKSSADPKNIERDPFTSSQEISSQSSNSHRSRLKHKGKNSNQSKESIPKDKPKSKLTKISSPSQNSKNSILHKLLNQIEKKKSSSIFIEPVDPVKLQIPTYFDIIKKPMAIQTMKKKVKQGKYEQFSSFEADLETIVSNCIKFNAGNNFFIQQAKRFSNEYKKVLQKFKEQTNRIFKVQLSEKSIESNSEQQTNSEDKVQIKKIQQREEQNLKKPINNESKSSQSKQSPNEQIKDNGRIEKENKQPTMKKVQKAKPQNDMKIKIKKYSYEDRLTIISRIKKLDRSTMSQFFKDINFSKGESLDFKVLEEEKIKQIEEKLIFYEKVHQQKIKEAMKGVQEKKAKQDLEIEEDKDYQD